MRPVVHTEFLTDSGLYPSQPYTANEDESSTNSCNSSSVSVMNNVEANVVTFTSSAEGRLGVGELFRATNARKGLKAHMDELDRFRLIHLEQILQGCQSDEDKQAVIQKLENHKLIQATTETLVAQLPEMAKMQAEVEKYQWTAITPALAEQLELSLRPRTSLTSPILEQFNSEQLKLILKDMHFVIDGLNRTLVKELTERDELYLAQGARCTEIDDLSAYFKELCVRTSIQRVRRKAFSSLSTIQTNAITPDQLPSDRSFPAPCIPDSHSDKSEVRRKLSFPTYSKPPLLSMRFQRTDASPHVL